MDEGTVVFVDLVGSTAIYQALGNAQGAKLVTGVTQWMGRLCEALGGRVLRYLGDGVLMAFEQNTSAMHCAIEIHRLQSAHNTNFPHDMQLQIKVGVARGQILKTETGWIGDTVNLATNLCGRCGPAQILATGLAVEHIRLDKFARFRNLGLMPMPGLSQPVPVFQVEWKVDVNAGSLTIGGQLEVMDFVQSSRRGGIQLAWAGKEATFDVAELPIMVGRHNHAHFSVNHPLVSRLHARFYELDQVLVMEDTSRHGTSVRFASDGTVLTLHGQECVLHDNCEIALGSPFGPQGAPPLSLRFVH